MSRPARKRSVAVTPWQQRINNSLPTDVVQSLIHYDVSTGLLTWAVDRGNSVRAGDVAGRQHAGDHYQSVRVCGRNHRCHRIAWVCAYGSWPAGHIDHINGDKSDNRLVNLRDTQPAVNNQNRRVAMAANKLGILGVSRRYGKFRAVIWTGGKSVHVGSYATLEEAQQAYLSAKRSIHAGATI